jgi:hypothetical protein
VRTCGYRHCDVDLDQARMRPQAKYCCTDHKDAERNARRHDPAGTAYPVGKPRKTAYSTTRRATRRGSGTSLYVLGNEARYLRAAIRGGKRPRLKPAERRRLQAKVDGAAERLAA